MCKPDFVTQSLATPTKAQLDSFATPPTAGTMAYYSVGILAILFAIEYSLRYVFDQNQHLHPLLGNETNRLILARHIGTDSLCCAIVVAMGSACFNQVCPDFLAAARSKPGAMPRGGYEARMFLYHPATFRICLFFASYQIKNLYDTILWNDGIVFVAHHVMCLFVCYGALFHGVAQYYAPFYFGISEISTSILCLLANFDDTHGVPGLADAFPEGKVVLGALFAVTFIICRVFLWSFVSYYFVRDAVLAINQTGSNRDKARPWLKIFLGALTGLSSLQVIWLGQIILVGMEEIQKL